MPDPADKRVAYSYAVRVNEVVQLPFPLTTSMTYDAFWRAAYQKANFAIQRQADQLVARGNITSQELRELVEVQRNGLVRELRKPLTPFGRLYSEILKPSTKLPTAEQLLAKKGSFEAVLRSAGGTRQSVNRIAVATRVAGPLAVAIEITMTIVVIELAPEKDKKLVASRQIGGAVGSLGAGMGGAWAGCASFGLVAAPTLFVPVIGEITEATACLAGGIVGGLGIGALGRWAGESIGESAYWRFVALEWMPSR